MSKILTAIVFFFVAFVGLTYSQTATVISEKANLRAAPSEKGEITAHLDQNTEVEIIRRKGPWYLVRSSSSVGWLHGNTIRLGRVVKEMRLDRFTKLGSVDSDSGGGLVSGEMTNAPVNKARPNTVAGGVLNGMATSLPRPSYPAAARAVQASGAVSVQVLIDESGRVVSATAVSGHPLLRGASESAALNARFSPTLLNGVPVKVSGVITYNFVP